VIMRFHSENGMILSRRRVFLVVVNSYRKSKHFDERKSLAVQHDLWLVINYICRMKYSSLGG